MREKEKQNRTKIRERVEHTKSFSEHKSENKELNKKTVTREKPITDQLITEEPSTYLTFNQKDPVRQYERTPGFFAVIS
jgi:hypothetical protein